MKRLFVQELGVTEDGRRLVRFAIDLSDSFAKANKGDAVQLPMELHIIPDGPRVFARDGRRFKISDPAGVIRASETPALVDWEHLSELPSFWGGSSKAAAWISGYSHVEGKGVVATVEKWTEAGAKDVADGTYRYLSPVLYIDGETEEVLQIVSVALTNTPALRLESIEQFRTALSKGAHAFRPSPSRTSPEDDDMNPKLKAQLCAMLGLIAATATDAEVDAALAEFQKKQNGGSGAAPGATLPSAAFSAIAPAAAPSLALAAETVSLAAETVSLAAYSGVVEERNRFKTELDAALAELAALKGESFSKRVADAFAAAAAEGQVTPAEREFELARITTQADLDKAVTAWSKRPKLTTGPSGNAWESAEKASTEGGSSTAGSFSKDQEKYLKSVGLKPESFTAARERLSRTTQEA